jgi:Alw26I/Eco31I/Esp3I family type II restriction m6 adenine DNA methyltransferase
LSDVERKREIEQALQALTDVHFRAGALKLLEVLGYKSNRRLKARSSSPKDFLALFEQSKELNAKQALLDQWQSAEFLFQLTGDEVQDTRQVTMQFEDAGKWEKSRIESYVFLEIELKPGDYTRTDLAGITRALNRLFEMPATVLFKLAGTLTLSVIDRRLHKRDPSKDVLEKVTLIKDVRLANPHRAHIEILHDLHIEELRSKHEFTSFDGLHDAWRQTLDISALNKRFYKEIADWYFWALKHVEFPKDAPKTEGKDHASVIRLITRLIFCWFIKEKGLIPDSLFDRRTLDKVLTGFTPDSNRNRDSVYYHAVLQNLFFATLDTEMDERDWATEGQHFMAHSLYRFRECFKEPDKALGLFKTIPFLNGGLFECLDKSVGNREKPRYVRVDGFSRRPDSQPTVPDFLFFGLEEEVDLSDDYGDPRSKKAKVRGLFRTFEHYKFTVTENTPIEEEVALDPELSGRVFENLLAAYNPETGATARKQTGSFFTPREIVSYMVDEALVACLTTKLETAIPGAKEVEARLRHLFRYTAEEHKFSKSETEALIAAIDSLKVLDPAVGSGAFPMGILHKLVHVLGKLDPHNEAWKEKQVAKAVEIPDSTVREKSIADIEQAFERNELNYGRKLYLIENCIYGVDIQPIAVQIAKMRFFISLVVDQKLDEAAPNRGIRPLPNLETKFVAANTLMGIDPPKKGSQESFRNPDIDRLEKELAAVRRQHFTARSLRSKRKLRDRDEALREEIAELLKNDGWKGTTARMLAAWDPYNQNAHADFFDLEWMFGIIGGVDIIIGNPPYGLLNKRQNQVEAVVVSPEHLCYFRRHPEYAPARGGMLNIYRLFIVKSILLLKETGEFSEIFPLAFVGDSSAASLRRYVMENCRIRAIEAFPERDNTAKRVFEAAKMSVCIMNLSRRVAPESEFSLRIHKDRFVDESGPRTMLDADRVKILDRVHMTIPLLTQHDLALLLKVYSQARRVSDIGHCYTGEVDLTHGRPYITTDPSNAALLRGAAVGRFTVRTEMSQGEFLYLKAKKYLAEVGGDRTSHYLTERIVMQGITGVNEQVRLKMTLLEAGVFCANSVNYIVLRNQKVDPKFLLGVLNSKLLNYVFSKFSTNSNVNGYEVDNLPIPSECGPDITSAVAARVSRILAANKRDQGTDTSAREREIDRLIYDLYGLTEDEIAIVEGRTR